jgi:hypothetical protein
MDVPPNATESTEVANGGVSIRDGIGKTGCPLTGTGMGTHTGTGMGTHGNWNGYTHGNWNGYTHRETGTGTHTGTGTGTHTQELERVHTDRNQNGYTQMETVHTEGNRYTQMGTSTHRPFEQSKILF